MIGSKTPGLSDELHAYLVAHGSEPDEVLQFVEAETRARFGDHMSMVIAPEQAAFLTFLTTVLGVRSAVEVGTFTGSSSVAIARGLPLDGTLVCLDVSEEFTAVAREAWERAGVTDRVELRIGDAVESLRALPQQPHVDLAFLDAAKTQYRQYYEELLPRLTDDGVIVVDNVLWSGAVIDDDDQSDDTVAIREFNDHVAQDDRVSSVMLPIADGLTLIRRR